MMMLKKIPRKEALLEAVLTRERERKAAVKRMEKEIQKLYDGYFLRVTKFLASKEFATKTEIINLESTQRALTQLSQILVEAGYEDTIASLQDEFEGLTKSTLKYFNTFGPGDPLPGIDLESLQVYATFVEKEFTLAIDRNLKAPIQSALLQVNLGNQTRESVVETILGLSDKTTPAQAELIVDDGFSQYQRAVIVQKAENLDMEIYQYLGPDDSITSEQCEFMLDVDRHGVPGMLYKDEITTDLHPKLVYNPLVAGGHPRCRHHWSPVTEAYAVSQGFELRKEAA